MDYNKVILAGRLTRDPELTDIKSARGDRLCMASLAVNEWAPKDSPSRVTFVDLKVWGKRAETLAKYLKKGSPVFVEGKLQTESWEKDGQKRQKLTVTVLDWRFVGKKDDEVPVEEAQGPF